VVSGLGRPALLLFLSLLIALPSLHAANVLPDHFGKFTARERSAVTPIEPAAVTSEYGVEASGSATYSGPQKFDVTVWRLKDSTAALAFYQWQRSEQPLQWMQAGNYVLHFPGGKPRKEITAALTSALPAVPTQPLPLLPGYLPERNLAPGSERYILGEVRTLHSGRGVAQTI
jgi:hypothetical protein